MNNVERNITRKSNAKHCCILIGVLLMALIFVYVATKSLTERKVMAANKEVTEQIDIEAELANLEREKQALLSCYLPHLDHVEIFYTIDELIGDAGVHVKDISFTRPTEEDINGYVFKYIDISLICEGKYENLTDLVENMRRSPSNLFISGFIIDKGDSFDIAEDVENDDAKDDSARGEDVSVSEKKSDKDLLTGRIFIRIYGH